MQKKILSQELYLYVLYPKINIEDCFKIAKEVVGIDYNFLSYELVEANGLLGALGQYYKLKLTINKAGDDVVLNLFAKFMIDFPKDAFPRGEDAFPRVGDAFPKDGPPTLSLQEEFVYTVFVPELKNIGLGNICDFLPRCYFMRSSDVMVFEDLTYSDYEAVNSEEPYSYEMLLLVVKKLAKMHACSLLYEEITSKGSGETTKINVQFSKYVMGFSQAVDTKFKDTIHYCNVNTTVNYIYNQFPDVAKEITMEEFRERSRNIFDSVLDKMKTSGKYRNVICHGDLWGGNMLFKFKDTRPVDCFLVDYQMIKYCPPAQDLMAFLYINTRTNYLSKLINDYYTEMSTIFKRYSFDLSTVYPYEVFMDSCEYMKSYAVWQAAAYYPSSLDRKKVQDLLGSVEETVQFFAVDKTEVLKVLMKHDWIRSRFREIVEHLYDLCLQK
ncbi:hypothetical protein NQ315_010911 [Exocentrus adspersus]|uniref:CHK kinase-like domain-containing protein n=1 Tax=Exocentrus adspersus TaxID=1586481 RepID=A0AAV8VP99_9CUCU|nr:hypothetical protein NQ315_010911 [Exocentrus adspersus]